MELQEDKLSIVIMTFNHEAFIGKVLDGIFAQKVNFNYRIYIHDDASTDQTVAVIKNYQLKLPGQITLVEGTINKGLMSGVSHFLNIIQSKYLVLSDGDDYWIHPYKLQTQIDFLEANPDYIASCHDAEIRSEYIDKNNRIATLQTKRHFKSIAQFTTYFSDKIEPYQLLEGKTYIQNCTLIWRKFDLNAYLPVMMHVTFNLDWFFSVILASKGKIQYINEPWAVYSDHSGGSTKNKYFHSYISDKITLLKFLKRTDFYGPIYFRYQLNDLLAKEYYSLIMLPSEEKKSTGQLLKYLMQFLRYKLLGAMAFTKYVLLYRKQLA